MMVLDALVNDKTGAIKSLSEVNAVGHCIAHGGREICFFRCDQGDEVLEAVAQCNDLAPLHNPANLIGINACKELMPGTDAEGIYTLSIRLCRKSISVWSAMNIGENYKVRRYGFHEPLTALYPKKQQDSSVWI